MKTNKWLRITLVLLLSILTSRCAKDEAVLKPDNELAKKDLLMAAGGKKTSSSRKTALKNRSGHYLVISADNTLPLDLENRVKAMKGKVMRRIDKIGVASVMSTDPAFASKCSKMSGIKAVVRDFRVQFLDPGDNRISAANKISPASMKVKNPPNSMDDDFLFDLQWGHDAINAPEAWKKGFRGEGAKIAILDTGFELDHPDLAANILSGCNKNFVPGETIEFAGDPSTSFSHGTYTAGLVAAPDNGIGIIGVAPQAKLILVKVLSDEGFGDFSWLIQGIVYAADKEADVINMSLSGLVPLNGEFLNDNETPNDPSDDFIDYDPQSIKELIAAVGRATTYAFKQGVTTFASTGNEFINADKENDYVILPAESPYVLGISATAPHGWAKDPSTFLDYPASYTNFGLSVVNFAAPGGDLTDSVVGDCTVAGITLPCAIFDFVVGPINGGWAFVTGTSASSPYAAGVAALIIGKHKRPISPLEVVEIMRASADDLGKPGKDKFYGDGRVNAFRAVARHQHLLAGK